MANHLSAPARIGIALLMAICLLAAWRVMPLALADIYRYQVRRDLNRWEQLGNVPELSQWRRARIYNRKSLRLDPENPAYLNQASRIWEWRLFVQGNEVEAPHKMLDRAISYQRRALQAQPSQARAWAHLAVLKARKLELDAEFEAAVERSLELGPWEPGVHIMLVDVGLMRWPFLADSTRHRVLQAFTRKNSVDVELAPWLSAIAKHPTFANLCEQADRSSMMALARQACAEVRAPNVP